METTYRLPAELDGDLEALREHIEAFQAGELAAEAFRSRRVPQGVYEQRQDGTFMLRIRVPGGGLLPDQLRCAAAAARRHGDGRIHLTTRQDIQVHGVPLESIHPALVELARAGLSTKGGGGNTVRNIVGCPDAGVCPQEVFDVTPYPAALTEFLLADPVSVQLPRKYKIAFAGCPADCVGALVNDLGCVARHGPDGPGFAVHAGGGLGPQARVGALLEEFVPAEDICLVAEAVKRVFDARGNRRNKHRARLRYLVRELGFERFRALYREELSALRAERPATPELGEPAGRRLPPPADATAPGDGFEAWRRAHVRSQKQAGYHLVHLPVPLGDLSADAAHALADLAERWGEGMLRVTPSQNLVLRWVLEAELPGLQRDLAELGLAAPLPPVRRELIACTGSATCRLGICLSQGLAEAVDRELDRAGIDLDDAADLRVHINGCPNSCGRHPIAAIGFHGKARRVGDRLSPWYVMQLGGRLGEGRTALAEGRTALAARDIPAFLVELLRAFRGSTHYPDVSAFLEGGGREVAGEIARGFQDIPSYAEDESYYVDWGAEEPFSLAGRGAGECSAGVFDLIRVDLASARDALEQEQLFSATVLAARAMLVTQGEEAKDATDSLRRFERLFLEPGHVDASFRDLIDAAKAQATAASPAEAMEAGAQRVSELVKAVEGLYEGLDQSLRFHRAPADAQGRAEPAARQAAQPAAVQAGDLRVDREADFRGVTCPLNYVKTKLLLGRMQTGQVLAVLLDEEGGRSVPASAEKDGHEVLRAEPQGDRWRVLLRKG